MKFPQRLELELPDWLAGYAEGMASHVHDDEAAMEIAVELSRINAERDTGGPFGALVTGSDGRIVSLGVNRVEPARCSLAHAEIMALGLAQRAAGTWNLAEAATAPMTLYTSCEPCAMCLGAIPWSGVGQVVCGAGKADAERAGFDEGERIADWIGMLERRGIGVRTGVLGQAAARVLDDYAQRGGAIYNP